MNFVNKAKNQLFIWNFFFVYKSTQMPIVKSFFETGASRGKYIPPVFLKALECPWSDAIRTSLWMHDICEGAGERLCFRDILNYLDENDFELFKR